jgi:hypothetical protein
MCRLSLFLEFQDRLKKKKSHNKIGNNNNNNNKQINQMASEKRNIFFTGCTHTSSLPIENIKRGQRETF